MKVIDFPKDTIEKCPMRIMREGGIIEDKIITMPFTDFLQLSLDAYEPLGKGGKAGRQADKLAKIIEAVNGEKVIRFEDADHETVKEAVEAMTWVPAANRLISREGGYRDAVEKAQDVKTPTKK